MTWNNYIIIFILSRNILGSNLIHILSINSFIQIPKTIANKTFQGINYYKTD